MLVIARTVAHLLRQLGEQDRALDELELVRHAYDFAVPLHSARFEVDGTPFHVHGLGVASVTSQSGAPAAVVAAAVLHNAYVTGDWGDGRDSGAHPGRRQEVRDALGADVEAQLTGLHLARKDQHLERALAAGAGAPAMDDSARWLVLLELADLFDKYDDGRIGYAAAGRGDAAFVDTHQDDLPRLARALGWPSLASGFEGAIARCAAEEIPGSLLLGRRFSELVPPRSMRPSWSVAAHRAVRRAAYRVRRQVLANRGARR